MEVDIIYCCSSVILKRCSQACTIPQIIIGVLWNINCYNLSYKLPWRQKTLSLDPKGRGCSQFVELT